MRACTGLLALILVFAAPPVAAHPVAEQIRTEADGSRSLSHELVVAAPRDAVWEAISTAEGWKTWAVPTAFFAPGTSDMLETSYDPAATAGDPGNIINLFVARLPGRLLVFRTVKAPLGFNGFEALRQVTQFLELSDAGPRATRVRLTGVGYPATPLGTSTLEFFREGNRMTLEMLRSRFQNGPIDWRRRLARPAN